MGLSCGLVCDTPMSDRAISASCTPTAFRILARLCWCRDARQSLHFGLLWQNENSRTCDPGRVTTWHVWRTRIYVPSPSRPHRSWLW